MRLALTGFSCGAVGDLEPLGVGMTYSFDAGGWSEPARVSIRFDGQLLDDMPVAVDSPRTLSVTDAIDVPARAGRVTLTARAPRIAPGRWRVTAAATVEQPTDGGGTRVWKLPPATGDGYARFEPVMRVRAPGARLGIWPALVLTGALLAFLTQLLLAPRLNLPGWRLVTVSVIASLIGLVTSKLYHKLLHAKESGRLVTTGLGIQGFVLGAVGSVAIGTFIADLPLLRALDAIVPGLLLAMTIGRFGCFFGGCCAGRPTGGRGLWSSDRRLGIRRVPVQLFEAGIAFTVGVGALLADVVRVPAHAGLVFVGGLAAYTWGRQLLFPLRDIRRQTRRGRTGMMALTAAVLVVDVALALTL